MKARELYEVYSAIRGAQRDQKRQQRLQGSVPDWFTRLKTATRYGPLIAALVAPTSTLYEIPGLTQPWYKHNGVNVADPTGSLVLSAVGLALNVSANALLVTRFSASNRWWKLATWASLMLWIIKTIIAVVNLSIFGTRHGTFSAYTYTEGFWCAVVGVCASGLISLLLSLYVLLHFRNPEEEGKEVRIRGQSFMLSMVILLTIVALEALIMSRIEGWTFFDGIYFSIVTAFTIGLGDFTPTHPASEVLLFPFAILTIAGLANQVAIIVGFLSTRGQERQLAWQALYEERKEEAATINSDDDVESALRRTTDLEKEMRFLEHLAREEEMLSMVYGLVWSLTGFVVFWVVGAAIFYALEGWSYGTSIYFTYVVLLTVGYGDYAPITAAGRVVFVIYALLAVPIVTSFAVDTVTSLLNSLTAWFVRRRIDEEGLEPSLKPAEKALRDGEERATEEYHFISHARLIEEAHKRWEDRKNGTDSGRTRADRSKDNNDEEKAYGISDVDANEGAYVHDDSDEQESNQQVLTDRVLELAVRLEDQARTLLLDALKLGSKEQLILRADKNLQLRDMQYHLSRSRMLSREESEERYLLGEQMDTMRERAMAAASGSGTTALEKIREYRQTYAEFLAAGSRLKRLQGDEQLLFERRRKDKNILVDRYGQPHEVGEEN